MNSLGKVACSMVVLVAATMLVVSVQAHYSNECKYIKLKQGNTKAECETCCAKLGHEMAVSHDACRCKSREMARACPCAVVHGRCSCDAQVGVHECPCGAHGVEASSECHGKCPCSGGKCKCAAGCDCTQCKHSHCPCGKTH